jgi:hypothetical protein
MGLLIPEKRPRQKHSRAAGSRQKDDSAPSPAVLYNAEICAYLKKIPGRNAQQWAFLPGICKDYARRRNL